MDSRFFDRLDSEIRSLVEEIVSFNQSERAEVLHFVDVGEYGLALETAFGIAIEERKQLTHANKMKMKSLAAEMGICDSINTARLP